MDLDMTSALDLDIAARGSFAYKTPKEGRKIFDRILEKTHFLHLRSQDPPGEKLVKF
jgi:hypothetical protein